MNKFLSRKFIFTLIFVLFVAIDIWAFDGKAGLQIYGIIGAVLGVYNIANVLDKKEKK